MAAAKRSSKVKQQPDLFGAAEDLPADAKEKLQDVLEKLAEAKNILTNQQN